MPLHDIGKLALRVEGDLWVAYYVLPPKQSVLLGSIRLSCVESNAKRKQDFMDLMMGILDEFLQEITGQKPVWGEPERAPESERAGRA